MTTYFLDLDGTLADSRTGLFGSFRAGLAAIGASRLSDSELQRFLGTPLPEVFRFVHPDLTDSSLQAGIVAFREYYEREGIFQNALYPGVRTMLAVLRDGRHSAWIVTSKPQPQAVHVASLLGIDTFVDGVIGAGLDETDTKTEIVFRALASSGALPEHTVMLGDRHYDVIGARENGVEPVGALWGYGSRRELRDAGCRLFAQSPQAFQTDFIQRGSLRAVAVTA